MKGAQGRLFTRTTRIGRHEGDQAVYFHDTPVVTWTEHKITLRTGGYLTPSTKMKMNQVSREFALDFHVFQEDRVWYVRQVLTEGLHQGYYSKPELFYEGMVLQRPTPLLRLLKQTLDTLARTPCTFWACEGPENPVHMITCSNCWLEYDIRKEIGDLLDE